MAEYNYYPLERSREISVPKAVLDNKLTCMPVASEGTQGQCPLKYDMPPEFLVYAESNSALINRVYS